MFKKFFNKVIENAPSILAVLVINEKFGISKKLAAALPPKNTPSA